MATIVWEDRYSVGNKELDNQHKVLIRIINQLSTEHRSGGQIIRLFEELHRYVREHFSYEEQLMKQANYANYDDHIKGHRMFEQWLNSVELAFNSGGGSAFYIGEVVSEFLHNWLLEHILVDDIAYSSVIKAST